MDGNSGIFLSWSGKRGLSKSRVGGHKTGEPLNPCKQALPAGGGPASLFRRDIARHFFDGGIVDFARTGVDPTPGQSFVHHPVNVHLHPLPSLMTGIPVAMIFRLHVRFHSFFSGMSIFFLLPCPCIAFPLFDKLLRVPYPNIDREEPGHARQSVSPQTEKKESRHGARHDSRSVRRAGASCRSGRQ